jgi:4-amino-4-deoxy-L-arabinose transferase-like glycosyltransferase
MRRLLANRQRVARIALVLSGVLLAWMTYVWFGGGFDTQLLGIRVRANDPNKTRLWAEIAFAIYIVCRGPREARRELGAFLAGVRAWVPDPVIVAGLAITVAVIGVQRLAPIAGGSDSYGYVSQADLWSSGRPYIEQPWAARVPWPEPFETFAPLGYKALPEKAAIAPTYSPGLPMLMAAVRLAAGFPAMFWIGPLSAALLVIATFGIGRRLGSSATGLAAAWLTATSPIVLSQMILPMADVPPAAAWATAFYFLFGRGAGSAAGAGIAAGLAILMRPNLVPIAGVMGAWLLWQLRQDGTARAHAWRRALAFAAALLPFFAAVAGIFRWMYGSALTSGYRSPVDLFTVSNLPINFPRYVSWLAETHTIIAVAGMAAVFVPARWLWRDTSNRTAVAALGLLIAVTWIEFGMFEILTSPDYLRYVLASWPAITLGTAAIAVAIGRRGGTLVSVAVAIVLIWVGVTRWPYLKSRGLMDAWEGECKYPAVSSLVRERTDPNSLILAIQHSGSVRYYGGRMTLRIDALAREWLDGAVAWLSERGVHTYLLLEAGEVAQFTEQFPGHRLTNLTGRRVFQYHGRSTVSLYDLTRYPEKEEQIVELYDGAKYPRPAAPPMLVFSK